MLRLSGATLRYGEEPLDSGGPDNTKARRKLVPPGRHNNLRGAICDPCNFFRTDPLFGTEKV